MAQKVRRLLRGLFREFRHLAAGNVEEKTMFSWRYIPAYMQVKKEFNKMRSVTNKDDIEDCMFNCELYFNYLQSVRREKELEEKYKGVGERPIQELAASVGLKLPEKYQDERDL